MKQKIIIKSHNTTTHTIERNTYNINAAHAFCTKLSELHLRIQAFNQNNKQKSENFK